MLRKSKLVRKKISEARFSRGIYNQIAHYIKALKTGEISVEKFADLIASMFEADNPLFDKQKFLQACGIGKIGEAKSGKITEDSALAQNLFNRIKYGGLTTVKTPEEIQSKVMQKEPKQPDITKKVTEKPGTGYPNLYGYFMGESKKGRK